eukprot:305275-Chlamydomonas_euryale.AAC.1
MSTPHRSKRRLRPPPPPPPRVPRPARAITHLDCLDRLLKAATQAVDPARARGRRCRHVALAARAARKR